MSPHAHACENVCDYALGVCVRDRVRLSQLCFTLYVGFTLPYSGQTSFMWPHTLSHFGGLQGNEPVPCPTSVFQPEGKALNLYWS